MRRPFLLLATLFFTTGLPLAYAATTTVDIPKLAAEFTKAVGLVDLKSCTAKAVDGTRYVCHGVTVQNAALPPVSFFCDGDVGSCWMPPVPESKSSGSN
jgi:hypothetical protein